MDGKVAKCTLFIMVIFWISTRTSARANNTTTTATANSFPTLLPSTSPGITTKKNATSHSTATMILSSKTQPNAWPTTTSMYASTNKLSPTRPTIQIKTTSSPDTNVASDDDGGDIAVVVVLAVFAGVGIIVALVFLFLYLRTSPSCYNRIRRIHRQSENGYEFDTVGNPSTTIPIRDRLASLSSIRRQAICKSEPLSILAFREHVKKLHADSDYLFSLEYEAVGGKKHLNDTDKKLDITSHEGKKAKNRPKNRFTDILPYDHSRVVLSEIENETDSDYINANYVDSYRKPRAYIAAQGPLSASLADFWRMIWETDARVVVMVTNLFERTKSKCVQYWPDKGSRSYGFLKVTLIKEEMFAYYVIRTLSVVPLPNQLHYVKEKNESEARMIQQFQFTEWPDHDVPVHPVSLLRFIRHSKSANLSDAGPLVVHCSAGIGRSGAYMVIDSMMERIEDEKNVDIFNFLNHIRTQRVSLVQEESQYVFVHDCILEHINFGDTNIPIRDFHKRLRILRTVNPETRKSRVQEEYEDINQTIKHPEKHKWAGKKSCNVLKNRRKDILPVERSRVKLPLVLGIDGADYINASFIDGFCKKREYIATQAPMVRTAECFYRMICSTKCSTIVMLLDDEQWQKADYADLPTEDEAVTCGKFEINLESVEVTEKVTIRKLRLFSSENSDGHTVNHFHYRDWPPGGFPKDKTSLVNFIERVREHKLAERSEEPIVVHCDYGVGPTGVFCLVSSLYEQIEREESVDVFHAAKLLRVQRPKLIETEDQYLYCYELLDQVIARKLISMATDSESDEPNSPGIVGNKNSLPVDGNPDVSPHTPEMNGSVVVDNSSAHAEKESPKAGDVSPRSAGNVSPRAGNVSQSESPNVGKSPELNQENESVGKKSPDVETDSPSVGLEHPLAIKDNSITEDPNPIAATAISNDDNPEISDTEQPNTTSSRQALLSSSDSS